MPHEALSPDHYTTGGGGRPTGKGNPGMGQVKTIMKLRDAKGPLHLTIRADVRAGSPDCTWVICLFSFPRMVDHGFFILSDLLGMKTLCQSQASLPPQGISSPSAEAWWWPEAYRSWLWPNPHPHGRGGPYAAMCCDT